MFSSPADYQPLNTLLTTRRLVNADSSKVPAGDPLHGGVEGHWFNIEGIVTLTYLTLTC